MVYIYILKLIKGKYYIGKTNNAEFRIESHKNNNGSKWTQIYNPIEVEKIIENCIDFDEDFYTLKYMEKYGIHNVRGGSFSQIKLCDQDVAVIQKMINTKNNSCFGCGSNNHFVNDCEYEKLNTNLFNDKY